MKRISTRILIATVSLTLATSLIIGGFIYINSIEYIKTESISKLEYMSTTYSEQSSRRLRTVESILETMRLSVINSFDTDKYREDIAYLLEFEESIDRFFRDTALNNTDFEGVYLTFNAELSGEFQEIWYLTVEPGGVPRRVDNELYNQYAETPTTGDDAYPNISQFSRDNPAMDYYFMALEIDGGFWSEPTMEVGLPMTIISYTSTVYKDGLLLGVIGIDINIENIRSSIRTLEIMQNGRAFLMNDNLEIIVHPSYPESTSLEKAEPATWELLRSFTDSKQGSERPAFSVRTTESTPAAGCPTAGFLC